MTYAGDGNCNDPHKPDVRSGSARVMLDAIGRFIARMLICNKKKSKKTSELDQLDPIGKPYEPSPSPDVEDDEQALDDDLDKVVARIDSAIAAQEKYALLLQELHSQDLVDTASPTNDKPNDALDPPGLYSHCDTGTTTSSQAIALISNSDDNYAVEAMDLSFDLEAAAKYSDFDCKDLGRQHSSMHVRNCKSKTCIACQKESGICFVKPISPFNRLES
mmetsp:Transcript_9026/g.22016  ORF Transcript_9026/g.22016 Transcript_9026/m.22016 type:complete len:219 (+) Transcript_9026:163-819(+)